MSLSTLQGLPENRHAGALRGRPGDKIVLEPGEHAVRDIRVSWPLHLVGGGGSAEDTLLDCPDSASGAFIFRRASPTYVCSGVQVMSSYSWCTGSVLMQYT